MGVFLLNLTKKAFRIKVTPFPLLLFPDEDSIEWKRRNKFNNNIFSDYANLFLNFELDEILEQQHQNQNFTKSNQGSVRESKQYLILGMIDRMLDLPIAEVSLSGFLKCTLRTIEHFSCFKRDLFVFCQNEEIHKLKLYLNATTAKDFMINSDIYSDVK